MTIIDTEIDSANSKWKKKHLDTIKFAYNKTPHFNLVFPTLETLYSSAGFSLADFNINLLQWICEFLEFKTEIVRSSQLKVDGTKTELLANICSLLHGDTYIIGMGGNNLYMDHALFNDKNIKIEQQDFTHPVYNQLGDKFISGLSVVDLLFNYGKESIGFFHK